MPPKQTKDQTKSTPSSKSANDKDTNKELQKKVTNLEKDKKILEQKLKEKDKEIERLKVEKDEEIERLKVVQGFCGEGDNVSTTPISRDLRSAPAANGTTGEGNIQDQSKEIKRLTEENKKLKEELKKPKDKSKTMQQPGVKKEDTSCSQVSLSDIPLEGLIDDSSNQTNNNSRETRSAPAANDTTGEGNIQDQSKEIKRLTLENEQLNEKLNKLTRENEELNEKFNKMSEDRKLMGTEFCRACKDIERTEGTRQEKDIKNSQKRSKEEKRNSQKPELNGENKNLESKISQLKDEIKNLNSQNEKLKDEIKNLNSQNEKLIEENKREKQKLYEEETKNSDLKKQNEELQKTQSQEKEKEEKPSADDKKNSDLTQKIKDLENKLLRQEQESQEKFSRVEQEKSDLKREYEELQKTLSQKENDNKSKLEEKDKENSKLSKTIDDLQTEIAQLKKANKSNSPKPAASRDLKDAEAQVKQLKENNEKLIEEKIKAVKEVNNLKNRLAEKDKEKSELTKTINDLQTEKEQLKKTNKSNSPKSAASRDLKDAEVKQLKERNEKLMEEKNKAVKEVDNLKNRLSQIAGSKLTDNNPGIADLSDPNRPLNLGEKFSELYDNQWTDAMEEMTCTVDEKQAIEILLRIVNDAYKFCVKISDGYCGQIEDVITKLFNTELSSLQKKLTKDYRKSMAVYLVSNLEEEFCKRSYKFDGESVKSYQKHCIRVCWFMAVQDPKVFIEVEDVSGKKFEDDKYKHYTKTGKVTDYLVWPVLYLHKGGPMLGKGVAQGK